MTGLTHFVVVGHPRSGSTLLIQSLRKNNTIRMYGEILSHELSERARTLRRDERPYREGDCAYSYLRDVIFRKRDSDDLKAVGCKIFFNQINSTPGRRTAWRYLAEKSELRIVHLSRRDLFASWVSYELAERTGQWARAPHEPPPPPPPPFRVDPAACLGFFEEVREGQETLRSMIAAERVITVVYEDDLCGSVKCCVRSLSNQLDAGNFKPPVPLGRQRRLMPWQQVANYAELRERFRDTPYESFFPSLEQQ